MRRSLRQTGALIFLIATMFAFISVVIQRVELKGSIFGKRERSTESRLHDQAAPVRSIELILIGDTCHQPKEAKIWLSVSLPRVLSRTDIDPSSLIEEEGVPQRSGVTPSRAMRDGSSCEFDGTIARRFGEIFESFAIGPEPSVRRDFQSGAAPKILNASMRLYFQARHCLQLIDYECFVPSNPRSLLGSQFVQLAAQSKPLEHAYDDSHNRRACYYASRYCRPVPSPVFGFPPFLVFGFGCLCVCASLGGFASLTNDGIKSICPRL